uniref:Uncharacterized protein n=1 Tax=Sinocyclocheilus rhinocerous TaxID=307959 RepID=A0A673IJY8_9TELE
MNEIWSFSTVSHPQKTTVMCHNVCSFDRTIASHHMPDLFLSVFPVGYPFALVYRWFLFHQSATVVHLFHTFSGLALATFNFGEREKEAGKEDLITSVFTPVTCLS